MRQPDWVQRVENYIDSHMPPIGMGDHEDLWDIAGMSAWESGAEALIALGRGELRRGGPGRLRVAKRPALLPRWDDLCLALLDMFCQLGRIELLAPGQTVDEFGNAANVASVRRLGEAYVSPVELGLLEHIGLVADGAWGGDAEKVLWRWSTNEWPEVDFHSEQTVVEAARVAAETIPDDTRLEFGRVLLNDQSSLQRAFQEKWFIDRRWRLDVGWLSEAERSVAINHNGPLGYFILEHIRKELFPDAPAGALGLAAI